MSEYTNRKVSWDLDMVSYLIAKTERKEPYIAQMLCNLKACIENLSGRLGNLGETKAKCIDFEDIPKVCGQPLVIEGTGAPSVVPYFVGQRYHDITSGAQHLYEAFSVTNSTSDWKLIS